MPKKFLDADGLSYLVSKLDDYPNNEILAAVIDGIDEAKQDTLVSGTNIKTINNQSLLGSENITVLTEHQDISGKVDKEFTDNNNITTSFTNGERTVGGETYRGAIAAYENNPETISSSTPKISKAIIAGDDQLELTSLVQNDADGNSIRGAAITIAESDNINIFSINTTGNGMKSGQFRVSDEEFEIISTDNSNFSTMSGDNSGNLTIQSSKDLDIKNNINNNIYSEINLKQYNGEAYARMCGVNESGLSVLDIRPTGVFYNDYGTHDTTKEIATKKDIASYHDNTKQNILTAGTGIDITNNVISAVSDSTNALKYYKKADVTGVAGTSTTQLSSTYDVTDADITEYYDGLMITFVLPVAGVTTYGSVFQINSLGYKPIVYGASSIIGTRYPAGGQITMVYNSVQTANAYLTKNTSSTITGCWQVMDFDSTTTDARRTYDYYFRPYAGANAIYRYKLCALDKDNRLNPITITNQTSTTQVAKVPTSVALRPEKLWFFASTGTVNAGTAVTAKVLTSNYYGDDICPYNFNTACKAYKMIYLRGNYDITTGLFTLYKDSSSPCTSYYTLVPNNTANITLSSYFVSGYYYWLVGSTYGSDEEFQLFTVNPLYYFDGTNLIPANEHLASQQITNALGYTPYNASNPNGFINKVESSDVINALGYTPASLDNGKIPSSQLPSYVDDVIEAAALANFPATGEAGKIYVALDTNKTYRWSGSAYVEISASIALGETDSTAYRGDRGKIAYNHSQATSGNPHNVSKSDLGIANVENKSSATIRGEITSSNVTTALGFTPYNATNPNGYISGINSSDVTTALGYIPYNSTNPNNYVNQTVNNLTNYYTKTEVEGMVGNRFQALIVSSLPASNISTSTIYMILQNGTADTYDEWMYISNTWTKIGTTSIDMSEYAKTASLHNVATTGAYSSLVGRPDIPDDTSDLTNGAGFVTKSVNNLENYTKTSDLADVALSGAYSDLTGQPTIPSAVSQLTNDANYISTNNLNNINVSTLVNDAGYLTSSDISALQDLDVDEIQRAIDATQNIGTVTSVTGGTGLSGSGTTAVTINHSNSVTAKTSYPSGTTLTNGGSFVVRDVKYDATGHVTSSQDRTITMTSIPAYDDTVVRGLIADEATARTATDTRVTAMENRLHDEFTSFVFCIFGIEPYIDPSTMQIVPNRYYQRSDVDTGIFMDNEKVDIHLKTWLKYHHGIDTQDKLKNVTCYVYAMGDHNEYVNHMVTFWSQVNNPSISSYPDLLQTGSFIDDGYGSVHRFTTTQVGAILSSSDDGYVAADPLGTGKGYVSGWNTLTGRVSDVEDSIGDIGSVLDAINGEVI